MSDPRNTADERPNNAAKIRPPQMLELLVAMDPSQFYGMDPTTVAKSIALLDTVRSIAIKSLIDRNYSLAYEVIENDQR